MNCSESQEKNYACSLCEDKYLVEYFREDGSSVWRRCKCWKKALNDLRLKRTPLYSKKDEYTFEKYQAKEDWQVNILKTAKRYSKKPEGWFFIGGQVGAGKTHICTAVVRNMAYLHDLSFEYMLFAEKMIELKQNKFDNQLKYKDELDKLLNTDILFIDDLFKFDPTKADLDILFEIINHRYLINKFVVISSEKNIQEILKIDEAIGSRILEKTEEAISISKDISKNYRIQNKLKHI